jgi:3-isopropylmalate/(R)-2-methylmalate dehydratase small subunit
VKFPIAPFAKHCLLNGIGEMDFLLGATAEIGAFESRRPTGPGTDARGTDARGTV